MDRSLTVTVHDFFSRSTMVSHCKILNVGGGMMVFVPLKDNVCSGRCA